jgi:hypothetical protein
LEWKKEGGGGGGLTRVAVGMYSGEGEYVAFPQECPCQGPAEVRHHPVAHRAAAVEGVLLHL